MKPKPIRLIAREAHDLILELKGWHEMESILSHLEEGETSVPYSDSAIDEWERLYYQAIHSGGRVTHSLALSYHARAWDLENCGDSLASENWIRALGFWRELVGISEFWENMCARAKSGDQNFDEQSVDLLRKGLMVNLLELHVNFIIAYADINRLDRSREHVSIIQGAGRVSPALKKKLTGRVYEAMTSAVPEALSKGETRSALALLDRFLNVFPDYWDALARKFEVVKKIAERLSCRQDWGEITQLREGMSESLKQVSLSSEYARDPLGRELVDQCLAEILRHCKNRSDLIVREFQERKRSAFEREEALDVLNDGIELAGCLGDLMDTFSPDTDMATALGSCLNSRACYRLDHLIPDLINEVEEGSEDSSYAFQAMQTCLSGAKQDLKLALVFIPNDPVIQGNYKSVMELNGSDSKE